VNGAAKRRVRALGVLTRLREGEIDQLSAELRLLQERIAGLREEQARLRDALEQNARVETLEAGFFLARYARSVRDRVGGIERRISELEPRRSALEARIQDLFVEAKTYETVEGRIRATAVRNRSIREADALAESFLMRSAHRGRQKGLISA
jgi:prefoldin subunit 5